MPKLSVSYPIIIGLTLGVGLGLSVLAALLVGRWEASRQQGLFQRQVENLATALQRSLNRYTDVLAFLGDHYRVADGQVNRQEFEAFVARALKTYPGIQALEWAPLISQAEREAFEQSVRAEGHPGFSITELDASNRLVPAALRPYYIPVHYVAPFKANEAAFGFDLNSNLTRRIAIMAARQQGIVTTTQPIRLVQEIRGQYGFLVFLPYYRGGTVPIDAQMRQESFEGVLLGVFRVSNVVEESLQDLDYDIDFVIYDWSTATEPQFLGRYEAAQKTVTTRLPTMGKGTRPPLNWALCPTSADCTRTLTVGDRQWQVEFSPSASRVTDTGFSAPITLLVGLLLTGSLVSFLHNLNQELVGAKTLNDLKLRFFSMASHELRTPLSTIMLSAESLQLNQDHWNNEQKRATVQRIYLTAKRMGQQIIDLLTLTRAEAGKLEFNPQLMDIEPFCQQIIEELDQSTPPRIRLIGPDRPTKAFWDRKLMRSLLTNLLSNALKYSPNDSPVAVTLQSLDQIAILTVCDHGIGIPTAEQGQVQGAFYRGSNVGDVPGTGLGLAIVNACVTLHRGSWTINSTEGQGTTVEVTLPLE